jgi:hypothetical protein
MGDLGSREGPGGSAGPGSSFAQSSEPVDLEIGAAEAAEDVAPRMGGRARIDMGGEGFPTEVPAVVRFVGVGPLEYPE